KDDRLRVNLDALSIRASLIEADPDNAEWQRLVIWADYYVGNSYEDLKKPVKALMHYQESLARGQCIADLDVGNRLAQYDLAWVNFSIGSLQKRQGLLEDASKYYSVAYAILKDLVRADPRNVRYSKNLNRLRTELSEVERQQRLKDEWRQPPN